MLLLLLFLSFPALAEEADSNALTKQGYDLITLEGPIEKDSLDVTERQALFDAVTQNPVAKLSMIGHYDPDGLTGFCFGRAMAVHLVARQMGLSEDSVSKLFVIGDLRSGEEPQWRFHVTTLVKGTEDGKLDAIDPIMRPPLAFGTPLLADQWITIVRRTWDKHIRARFYLTNPHVVTPDMSVFPTTPEDETGERIIDINKFDPETKAGISPIDLQGELAYALDIPAEETYMIRVEEPEPFHFLEMLMKILDQGQQTEYLFDFRNYFPDLLASLTGEVEPGTLSLPPVNILGFDISRESFSAFAERFVPHDPYDLHGMRVPSRAK